ncbi:MAG: hypothetical protein H6742_00120 [Alphaproteobacteria bacterium]|nr:hypothetical protein [Alphaproteobacteria bacterium]
MKSAFLLCLALVACGDKAEPAATDGAAAPPADAPDAVDGAATDGAAAADPETPPADGVADAAGMQPLDPAMGEGGGPPPEGGVSAPTWGEGDKVTVSGTIVYTGKAEGPLRIDILYAGEKTGPAYTMGLGEPGAFSVEAPKGTGPVNIVAFVDVAGDGPSPTDPAGRTATPVTIGSSEVKGITIKISDDPELGDLTPGGGGPPAGALPEGGAPDGGKTDAPPAGPPLDASGNPIDDGSKPPAGEPVEGGDAAGG